MKPSLLEGGHDLPTPKSVTSSVTALPGVTEGAVTPLESSSTTETLERYRVTVFEKEHEKNQENPQDPQLKRLKSPDFYDPRTMTLEELEKGIAAARADWHRNLPADYRVSLGEWIIEVESILETLRMGVTA
jgi:hypothetical protein